MIGEVQLVVRGLKRTTTDRHIPLLIDMPGQLTEYCFLFPVGTISGEKRTGR